MCWYNRDSHFIEKESSLCNLFKVTLLVGRIRPQVEPPECYAFNHSAYGTPYRPGELGGDRARSLEHSTKFIYLHTIRGVRASQPTSRIVVLSLQPSNRYQDIELWPLLGDYRELSDRGCFADNLCLSFLEKESCGRKRAPRGSVPPSSLSLCFLISVTFPRWPRVIYHPQEAHACQSCGMITSSFRTGCVSSTLCFCHTGNRDGEETKDRKENDRTAACLSSWA